MIRAPVEIWYIQRRRSNMQLRNPIRLLVLKSAATEWKECGGLVAFIRIVLNDVQKAFA